MRLFKGTYRDREGKKRTARKWTVEFRDHQRRTRRLTAFADKGASREFGAKVERLADLKANGQPPDGGLVEWLEGLPPHLREKLAERDLLDGRSKVAAKPLAEHLKDFRATLKAKGNTERYVQLVCGRVERVLDGCGFKVWTDVSAAAVRDYLAGQRADSKDDKGNVIRGISAQTSNFYLQAVKQFAKWMVREGYASASPLEHLQGLNVRTDRRHDRRALTVAEVRRLLTRTAKGPDRYGMTGSQRAMLYRLAVETGLRAAELGSLTRASFNLDAERPIVTVAAAYSKHRRDDTVPLRHETAATLKTFLGRKGPAAPAFRMPESHSTAKMFAKDREAANIPEKDDAGRVVDFHALRHTFLTLLAQSGVHPRTAKALARHSTITLTMDRYTHSYLEDESAAVAKLPDVAQPDVQEARATGTGDESVLAPCLAPNTANGGSVAAEHGRASGAETGARPTGSDSRKSSEGADLAADGSKRVKAGRAAKHGAPGVTRTPDLRFRKPPLYPAELRAQVSN